MPTTKRPPTPTQMPMMRQVSIDDFFAAAAAAGVEGAAAGASKRLLQKRQRIAWVWIVSPHWGQGRVSSAIYLPFVVSSAFLYSGSSGRSVAIEPSRRSTLIEPSLWFVGSSQKITSASAIAFTSFAGPR